MSTASEVLVTVKSVVTMLEGVADAFGLDRAKVIRVAAGQLPELRESPPDIAGPYFEARDEATKG